MNTPDTPSDPGFVEAVATGPHAGLSALRLQADRVMERVTAVLRAGALSDPAAVDAMRMLDELAGALALAGEQGLAALAGGFRCCVQAATKAADATEFALPGLALRLGAQLRHGLERSLRGQPLQAADLLPAWRAMTGTARAGDLAPLLSLRADEVFDLQVPAAAGRSVPADPMADAERALLDFLRASGLAERRHAAGALAGVLAEVASTATDGMARRLWRVLHAYLDELAADQIDEPEPVKHLLAQIMRALRHRAAPGLSAMLAPLARQALFALAQRSPSTAAGQQVARAFRLEQQLSPSPDGGVSSQPLLHDANDEAFRSQLGQWVAMRESLADGLGPVEEWQALVELACRSGCLAPVADAMQTLAGEWGTLPAEGGDRCIAGAMLCLHQWGGATSCAGTDVRHIADLLVLAAVDPPAAQPALQTIWRLLERQSLMSALAAACSDAMESAERLLEAAPGQPLAAEAKADVRQLLTAMRNGARMLALASLLPLTEVLIDLLEDFQPEPPAGDDGNRQRFAFAWVLLADQVAMLPWLPLGRDDSASMLPEGPGDAPVPQRGAPATAQDTDACPLADPLAAIFLEEASHLLAQLRSALLLSDDGKATPATADALHAAHTLAGCAATVGLSGMGRLAHALESSIESEAPMSSLPCGPELIREVLDTLDGMLAQFADSGACRHADTLVARLQACATAADAVPDAGQIPDPLPPEAGMPEAVAVADWNAGFLPCETHEDCTPETARNDLDDDSLPAADTAAGAITGTPEQEDGELLAIFREEAADLLPGLGEALRLWEQNPDDPSAPTPLLRILHTLKGSARMAGQLAWGDALHRCESEVSAIVQLAPSDREARLAALQVLVDEWRLAWGSPTGSLPVNNFAAVADAAEAGGSALQPEAVPAGGLAAVSVAAPAPPPVAARPSSSSLLRVRTDTVATFAETVAELWIGHARLADGMQQQRRAVSDLADTLARLRAQVRELEIDAESRIASVAAPTDEKGFDPLEFDRYTRLHEITRMITESAADLGDLQRTLMRQGDGLARNADAQARDLRSLQSSLQAVRSQPFATIEARLRHVTRQAAREAGREVECVVTGAAVEVDRSLLDSLAAPLEHLLRNAVVHGIEPPAERAAVGKPRAGRIALSVFSSAAELRLELADDGRGLDLGRIRDRASAVGLLTSQAEQNPRALSDLIFEPGFSTASEVTALAGRGIGLDAVRSQLHALGGHISVDSQAGAGCCFTICVPLSLATLTVLLVRAGRHCIGLPAPRLQQLLQLKPGDPGHHAGSRSLRWQGLDVPMVDLGHLLGEPAQADKPGSRVSVAVLREAGRLLALKLDAVEGQRELVVKSPGPQLSRLPGLSGASLLGDGSIALIIDPFRLDLGHDLAPAPRVPVSSISPEAGPLVLVVDDSLTVRRASQRLLERHGYEVALARDGIEALALLRERRPAALLLDIEMPRMDGFELLSVLRGDSQLRALPVVMITSRIADRHRQRAQQLGASAYMGKPFREEELVSLLAGLCRSTAGVQNEGRMEEKSAPERPAAAA